MKRKILLTLIIILCCAALLSLASCSLLDFIFGGGDPDGPGNDPIPSVHVHEPERKTLEKQTCTGEGEISYWQCKGCGKCFADEKCEREIADLSSLDSGHLYLLESDENGHFQQCKYCSDKLPIEAHESDKLISNKNEHYEKCTVCGYVYNKNAHVFENDKCSICGYSQNYADKCSSNYGYDNLADININKLDDLKTFYNALDDAARNFHDDPEAVAGTVLSGSQKVYYVEKIPFSGLSTDEAMSVLSSFLKDNPLYYWIPRTVRYNSESLFLGVDDIYRSSYRIEQNAAIYAEIDNYLDLVAEENSAYNKVLALHDKMIENINYAYDEDSRPETEEWAHNILGVLSKRGAVCEGYAKTASLLMNACNVENVYVTGNSRNVGHAWNAAEMDDGKWYWFDFTWDDQPSHNTGKVYDYFCGYGKIFKDHTVSERTLGLDYLYPMPDMSNSAYNRQTELLVGSKFTIGSYTYEVNGFNSVALAKFEEADANNLQANVTYNGKTYSLTEIRSSAFSSGVLKTVTIPESVKVIGEGALSDCVKLEKVVFLQPKGWTRVFDTVKESIPESDLSDPVSARDRVLEIYRINLLNYGKYAWIRSETK